VIRRHKAHCETSSSRSGLPRPSAGPISPPCSSAAGREAESPSSTAAGASSGTSGERPIAPASAGRAGCDSRNRSARPHPRACSPTSTARRSAGAGSARESSSSDLRRHRGLLAWTTSPSRRSCASTSTRRRGGMASPRRCSRPLPASRSSKAPPRSSRPTPSTRAMRNIDAYTGYLPMYLAAGYEPVKDAGRRTIVRRSLP
jgi:hypothetical protein